MLITHPEKVLFPGDGITKGELTAYYEAIAPVMLPHLRRRPITMERFPIKTTGSKGFHIAVPLDGKSDFGTVARFAQRVGRIAVERDPDHLTQEFMKVDRGGRILVDTGRNGYSATFAATYTVRARPGAPVSAPCTWEEIERGEVHPKSFTLRTMAQRINDVGDLWSDLPRRKRSLKQALRGLDG